MIAGQLNITKEEKEQMYKEINKKVLDYPLPKREIMGMIEEIIKQAGHDPLEVFDLCLFCFTYGQLYKNRKV